jgi:hypothetical protein
MIRKLPLLLLLVPTAVLADRGELYTLLEVSPAALRDAGPFATGAASWKPLPVAGQLLGYYGLTHGLHVGASLGLGRAPNWVSRDVAWQLPDGSSPTGNLYEDLFTLRAGGLASYRLDTGYPVAPVGRLELGLSLQRFSNRAFIPSNTTLQLPVDSSTTVAPYARVTVGAEVRFANHWLASFGLGGRRLLGSRTPWQVEASLAAGYIWW